jgi:peptide/nickel transport system substrate-binding protein
MTDPRRSRLDDLTGARRFNRRRVLGTGLALGLGSALPAFGATPSLAQTDETPVRGGQLTIGQMGDVGNLDPHSFGFVNYGMIAQIYDRLAHYAVVNGALELQPELAERWAVSEDGLTLTLTLRQGVMFHNGREMTADDVVANYEKTRVPETGGHMYQATLSVESVAATGPYEVQVKHKAPTPEMFDTISRMSIVAPESFESLTQSGIGTGPFQFVEWVPVDHMTLRRNEAYWDAERPYLDEVIIKPYNDQAAMQIALQSGSLQAAIGIPYKDAERLSGELQIIPGQTGATWYTMYASAKQPPFDNQLLRKAMQYAINRQLIVDAVLFGYGEPVWTPWPKTSLAYDPKWENFYPYDLEMAKQLITEAGFPDGFEAEIMAPTAFPELADMALILQADLAEIGVTLNLSNLGTEWGDRLGTGEYNLTFSFAGRSHLDPVSAFDNSAFRHVNNPLFPDGNPPAAYTEAVTAAKTTLDPAARKEALTRATEILLEESFAMSVSWRLTLFGAGNQVRDFEHTVDDFVVLKNAWLAD